MIVKITLVTCILCITCSKNVNGASFSQVYVESDIVPVEYYQYGAPASVSGAHFSRIAATPEETVVPLTSVPGLVTPCGTPCFFPSQAVPSTNVLTYRTSVPNVPVLVAPTKNEATGYEYSYVVYDDSTGDHKSQRELSDGSVVRGEYSFIQPDGYVREVQYVADDVTGFNAVVKNFLPTKVDGKKVEVVEKKETDIPCHEIKHESLKKGSSEEESEEKISHRHEKKHKKDSKESSEELGENSKESSHESVIITKEKLEPINKHKKESKEESVEESKGKHSGESGEQSEQNEKKNHSKELSEESNEESELMKKHHPKNESKEDSSEESLEIKAKPHHKELTEKSVEISGESPNKTPEKSSKESDEKTEEQHKPKKESSEESEEHKKSKDGSEEESEEKSEKGCNEESHESNPKPKEKSKEQVLEESVEKLGEEIKEELDLVTHAEHKAHELEPVVPHNDIVRCIQEAIDRSNEKHGHQRDEPSPLTYIILNKPC